MSKERKSDVDRRRFLSSSAMLAAGATAAANFPKELIAAEVGRPASPPSESAKKTDRITETKQERQVLASGTRDLSASIQQSAADKVLNSVSYPFCVFEQSWPFNGRAESLSASYEYTEAEIAKLLKEAQDSATIDISSKGQSDESQLRTDVLKGAAEIIESAKRCLEASKEAGYKGPDPKEVKKVVDLGVSGLLESTRGIQFKAHLAWLKVCIADRPSIKLGNPRISINGLHVLASATGELWWYHPTFHCSWFCLHWSVTWSWDRIASLTLNNVKISADAHADTSTAGAIVNVRGSFDRLRLQYPILEKIPLEGVANNLLGDKLVRAFDASQFIASIPVMNSKFRIDKVELPASSNEIDIDLSVKQI